MAKNQKILTDEQEHFLNCVSKKPDLCKSFYFTGGTPLAAFYLRHRLSEDIDLFSEQEIPLLAIRGFIKEIQKPLRILKMDYRQFLGLHTFQLYFSKNRILKVDFNYYPFPRIERGIRYKNIPVDSLIDIAVNKVHTIAMQPRARDFIDLYFIFQESQFNLHDLLMKAKAKFDWHIDPLQLGSRLLMATEMKDYPRMIRKIDHLDWKTFFLKEAEKLKKAIFKL